MQHIKTQTQAEAQVIANRVFNAAKADGKFAAGTTAYAIPENVSYFTIPILEGFESYFTAIELSGAEQFAEYSTSRNIIDDLLLQLKNQSVTTTQMDTLLTKLQGVLIFLLSGHIRVARFRANALTTDTLYTSARKTWLLNRMDLEIVKL